MIETDKREKVYGNHRAKVLDVADPYKVGRVKVEVYPFYKGIDSDILPWAVPAMPLFDGAGSGTGCLCIPSVGSYVWVFFEAGDIYQPVYFAEAQTRLHGVPSDVGSGNYKGIKALQTSGGFQVTLDDVGKTLTITHPDGAKFTMLSDGRMQITNTALSSVELLHLLQAGPTSPFIKFDGTVGGNIDPSTDSTGRGWQGTIKVNVPGILGPMGMRIFKWKL